MRPIKQREQQEILLEIAKEFHKICFNHNIKYYMLGGTMLGAIRHKGFIPWDDDMDFGIFRDQYQDFCNYAQKELPSHLNFLTVKTSNYAILGIGKISNRNTYVPEDYAIVTNEKLGINIDIFPLDYVSDKISFPSKYWYARKLFKLQKLLFIDATNRPFLKRILANVCKKVLPINRHTIVCLIDKIMLNNKLSSPTKIANVYGAWGKKEVLDINIMGEPTLYNFEDTQFYGVEDFDGYLKQLYSDYMKLPSEEKRHTHSSQSYHLESH